MARGSNDDQPAEMVQFGGDSFGAFRRRAGRGVAAGGGWNVNYQAGLGNGRGNVISRAGDAGDNNNRPAWLLNVFTKPDQAFGLQVGGSAYFDPDLDRGPPDYEERDPGGTRRVQHEDPEFIAEIADVRTTK